jgi:NADH-quinone oxidoreductase subunit E
MAWKTIDRITPVFDKDAAPLLSEAVRAKIRSFFERYEFKRAVLLPALHIVQDALGSVPPQAMVEVAELLEIHPSDVMDTASFYTQFWTHHKGAKLIMACRSLSCEVMGGNAVLEELKRQLGIDEHGTTPDGKYSLVTEECLAGCDHAPCLLINEKMHKRVKPEDIAKILADAENDQVDVERSDLFDAPAGAVVDSADAPSETNEVPQEGGDAADESGTPD